MIALGQHVGHYAVVSRLGSGGMGVVYLGHDTRLDRRVAIKVLPDGRVADELARTRFRREAQALSRLNHPNIATIYDFDQMEGRDFLVMEYIEGKSLRELGPDPLPPAEVVRIGTQLAGALAAAHGAGVVHLDLKPGNLMLTPDGRLKVLDFGISRLHAPEGGDTGTHTGTAANAAGTPPYMAPEQVAAGPVDRRTDIYGAGATLYELATGHRLFSQPRGVELFEAILRTAPEPPSRYNAAIDPALEKTLLKALEKSPLKRQQDAQELLHDFELCTATAGSAPVRTRRWSRREMIATTLATITVLGATGYVGYTLWPVPAGARFKERGFVLVGDFDNRAQDPSLSRTVQEALTISLQQSQFVNLVSRDRVVDALRRMRREPATPVDESVGLDICRRDGLPALITGAVSRSGGTTRITVKVLEAGSGTLLVAQSVEYTKADQLFARVDDLVRQVRRDLGESMERITKTSAPLAQVTTGSQEALNQYSKAVEARAMGNTDAIEVPLLSALALDRDFAMAHLKLGDYYMSVAGDDRKALPHIDTAYRLRDRVSNREGPFIEAQYFSAHEQYEQGRERLEVLTTLYPDDPDFQYELAIAYYALEQLPQGIRALRRVVAINPHAARAHASLALLLARDNQPDAAIDACRDAQNLGVESPSLYWARGLARLAKDDVAHAREDFDILGRTPGYYTHLALLQHARVSLYGGDLTDAIARLRRAVDLTRREQDPAMEGAARVLLGRAAALTGDLALAREQSTAVRALLDTPDIRPADVRESGSLALAARDPAAAEQQLARLTQLEASSPTPLVRASRLTLAAELAFYKRQFANAAKLEAESLVLRPWYLFSRARAQALEASGERAAATQAWSAILAARGQVLQDGFPPDLQLAQAAVARLSDR